MKYQIAKNVSSLFICASLLLSCTNPASKDSSESGTTPEPHWESLFNGENLEGWYSYQKQPEASSEVPGLSRDEHGNYMEAIGLHRDPLHVFTVVTEDDAPSIRISGEVFGILVTEKEYENYHLSLQFKWGTAKYPPRKNEKRDSGILYHSTGSEGAWGGVWMRSLECQVQEGDCGDYISVDTVLADIPATLDTLSQLYLYSPESDILTFSPERSYCHKSMDYEKPSGEWNTMEIYTYGDKSLHVVNGKVNMRLSNSRHIVEGKELPLTRGKIQLQSEGAEVFYKNIKIKAINELPAMFQIVEKK
jgi:3-keto-disaccharide hydrolase